MQIMNVVTELRKRNIEPYQLTEEEFEQYYFQLYNIQGSHAGKEELFLICSDAISMFQLRQAGYSEPS